LADLELIAEISDAKEPEVPETTIDKAFPFLFM
jgi:hypothetical protein